MLKKIQKFISVNKVATSYVAIGFLILSATVFLIQKNTTITNLKKEVFLLDNLRFNSLQLKHTLDVISPEQPQREILSQNLDSITIAYRQFIHPYRQLLENPDTETDLAHQEQVILYLNSVMEDLDASIRYLIYKQNVKDSIQYYSDVITYYEDDKPREISVKKENRIKYFTSTTKETILKSQLLTAKVSGQFNTLFYLFEQQLQEKIDLFERVTIVVALCLFLSLSLTYFTLKKTYLLPLFDFNKYSGALLSGKYKLFNGRTSREFKTIVKTVNSLVEEINITASILSNFKIEAIESEKSKHELFLNKKNPLPKSISSMFDNLSEIALVENERKWTVEGQAKFSNLLSKNIHNLSQTLNELLPELVRYIGALQGAIFIDNNPEVKSANKKMALKALYAYDRIKYQKKTLEIGEGLSGQVWQEGKPMVINNLPEEHAEIKSGLGEKQPKTLVIYPIIDNEVIHGLIELASFKKLPPYKIEFIASIVEILATTIASFRVNQKTKDLLIESQTLAKQMQEKDEETKRHLKALQSAKEEMEKSKSLKENEIKALRLQIEDLNKVKANDQLKYQAHITDLEAKLTQVSLNSPKTKELETQLLQLQAQHEQEVKDLKETLKIKDLRIDKLRKKIQTLQ